MPDTKKILITTESHEKFILRVFGAERALGHCAACGREVELVTMDQGVSLSGVRTGELIRLAEAGEIHSIETDSGHLLFCRGSVQDLVKGS